MLELHFYKSRYCRGAGCVDRAHNTQVVKHFWANLHTAVASANARHSSVGGPTGTQSAKEATGSTRRLIWETRKIARIVKGNTIHHECNVIIVTNHRNCGRAPPSVILSLPQPDGASGWVNVLNYKHLKMDKLRDNVEGKEWTKIIIMMGRVDSPNSDKITQSKIKTKNEIDTISICIIKIVCANSVQHVCMCATFLPRPLLLGPGDEFMLDLCGILCKMQHLSVLRLSHSSWR